MSNKIKDKKKQKNERIKKINKKTTQNINGKKQADEKSARINKRQKIKNIIKWTTLIAIIIAILTFILISDVFNICNIEVIGNEQVSTEEILSLSKVNLNDNIFLYNKIETINSIKQNPYIKSITVKRKLPDKIQIEIQERQKDYVIQLNDQYFYIDNQGYILEKSMIKIDKPKLEGYATDIENILPGDRLIKEDLEKLDDILKIIKSSEEIEINNKITSINIKNKNNYILTLQELKKVVYIGDSSNLANKMLYIKAIIEKENEKEGKIFVNGNFNNGFEPYFREEQNNY